MAVSDCRPVGGPRPKAATEALIFTNVNVVNMRDGGIAHGMTVVIKKGRIDGVAKVGFVAQDRNIQIVNANGKYLIPGLWDMHVHTAFVSPAWDEKVIYPLYIANGVTGVRDMGGDPDVLENRRNRIESGELLGPHLILAGPFLARGKERPADHRGEFSGRGASGGGHGKKTWPGFRQSTFRSPRRLFCNCGRIRKTEHSVRWARSLFGQRQRSLCGEARRALST